MLRFLGFKASLNFSSGKANGIEHYDKSPGVSLTGAYRLNKDELFGSKLYAESTKKITPSMVRLPSNRAGSSLKKSKSANTIAQTSNDALNARKSTPNLSQANDIQTAKSNKQHRKSEKHFPSENPSNEAINLRKSIPNVSQVHSSQMAKNNNREQRKSEKEQRSAEPSNGAIKKTAPDIPQASNKQTTKTNLKEQKILEKQRLAEQKKQQKLAEKERQREEKMRKERQKHEQQIKTVPNKSNENKSKKRSVPQPQHRVTEKHLPTNSQIQSNTLESSISKSSGPPPYSQIRQEIPNQSNARGNISYAKPVEDIDSWDLISQHRQQMSKQTGVSKNAPKQTRLDLHYNVGPSRDDEKDTNA